MRLLDDATDRKLDSVTLYLKRSEARELLSKLSSLIADLSPQPGDHHNIPSEDHQKEITICLYEEDPEGYVYYG